MTENITEDMVDGRKLFEEDYARWMSDPAFRALYEQESEKKDLWLQLVEARLASGLTQRQVADRLGVSQAQVSRLEKSGYDHYTLESLRKFLAALDMNFTLHVSVERKSESSDTQYAHA